MRCTTCPTPLHRSGRSHGLLFSLLSALALTGCSHEAKISFTDAAESPAVRVIRPPLRTIVRVVGQPSFIESYERTSIYAKPTAYIEKWIVDIGDKVKKGEVLATLFVPELVEDFATKNATVELDQQRIDLAKKIVEVAAANVQAAAARVTEAKADLDRYQAEVDRWDSEVKRLTRGVEKGVVDAKILVESTNQWKSSTAARDAAKAIITTAEAELLSRQAALAKAKVEVDVAEADLKVAESEARRMKAWVGYLTLTAPYNGVIVGRNANTLDFVMPATGDPTAMMRNPDIAPSGAAPIYVVDRTDIVRIFVDVPEQDANFVHIGTKAAVLARAYRDQELPASVTRTSWALNVKSRTLRAEIDLPNPGGQLLPGMYAYAKVIIEHPAVRALPEDAVFYVGDQTFCWTNENGHAVRTEIQTGVSDGQWIEVTNRHVPTTQTVAAGADSWTPINGTEQVIQGELSSLIDGGPVRILTETGEKHAMRQE